MKICARNIIRHELIGLEVKVAKSSDKSLVGLTGKVIDETMKTLLISCEGREKRIPKNICTFHFNLPGNVVVEVEGWAILGRPEERVKKVFRRLW